jgi:hypothetical protein
VTYGPFRKNKNPCKEGFLPMSAGNGLLGDRDARRSSSDSTQMYGGSSI